MTLSELKMQWARDCIIDENDLGGAAIKTSNLHSFYINENINIKLQLVKLQMELATLQVARGRYFRGEMPTAELKEREWEQWNYKTLRADVSDMILASPDVQILLGRQEYLKIIIGFLDSVLGEIKARSFNIRNAIDWAKFRAGN
jgi:hypothetical protein